MIRLGLIGVGGYGRWHLESFAALQGEGLVRITSVADSSEAMLAEAGAMPGLMEARRFTTYQELLAGAELDAVVIAAPIPLHREMTLAALERGLFILLEKPPVPLLSELDELIAADAGERVMVAFQHIYSDLAGGLKRDLAAGRIGDLVSISAHGVWPRPTNYYRRSSWAGQLAWKGRAVIDGPCTNACAHFINLSAWLAGNEMRHAASPRTVSGEAYRARPDLSSYDTGCVTGVFENDVRFFMGFAHNSAQSLPVAIRVRGTRGTLELVNDCRELKIEGGAVTGGNDGKDAMRRAFLAFADGDASRNMTPLRATRPYVLATNMMFASSGGIHPVPDEYVRAVETGGDGHYYEVAGIAGSISQSAERLVPLCETGAPWARSTRVLDAAGFSESAMLRALNLTPGENEAGK